MSKKEILYKILAERNKRRDVAICTTKEVIQLTSDIEANNNKILRLMEANNILEQSRKNYEKEVGELFDKENPCEVERNKLKELEMEEQKAFNFQYPYPKDIADIQRMHKLQDSLQKGLYHPIKEIKLVE